jgi:hypothetical protein
VNVTIKLYLLIMSVSEAISVVFAIPPVARITPIDGASKIESKTSKQKRQFPVLTTTIADSTFSLAKTPIKKMKRENETSRRMRAQDLAERCLDFKFPSILNGSSQIMAFPL